MSAAISMLGNGALSTSADDHEIVDELIDRLCLEVNIEGAGLLSLTVE